MRKHVIWTSAVIVAILGLAVIFRPQGIPFPNITGQYGSESPPDYLAIVNGVAITPEMIDRELKISRLNVTAPLPALAGEDLRVAREEALNQLIDRQLVLQAASRQGFSLDDDTIQQSIKLLYGAHSDTELDEALAQVNATRDELEWWIGEIFTVQTFTTDVILAGVPSEKSQAVYNTWFNQQRAEAKVDYQPDPARITSHALVGQPAPDFTLTTPDGRTLSPKDYAGRVVLVNFWATWCSSCIAEMPDYEQVYQDLRPNFVVLGVNLQEGAGHVQQFATGLNVSFPVLLDEDGDVTRHRYRVTGMPGSFIIDQDGMIFYRHTGPMSAETLRQKLAELGL